LAHGNFSPEDITVTVSPSNRKIDPNTESKIDIFWEEKVKKAKANDQLLYNGLSYRLNAFAEKDGKLSLDFGIFDFKTRECLPEVPGYEELGEDYFRKGCFTSATVKTSDDKYLLVELTGKSMNRNQVDFLGGIMETEPPIKNGQDIFVSLYQELEEEAFIHRGDIQEAKLKLLFLNSRTNACFYFEVALALSSKDLQKRFDQQTKEVDIRSLKIYSWEDYIPQLKQLNENKKFIAESISK